LGGIIGSGRFQNLSWSLLALVWIPMFAFLVWGRGGVLNHMNMRREVSDIEAEIKTLRQENEKLKDEIHLLETDPGVYEGVARQRLFRKKPGEIVLYLPVESDIPDGSVASAPHHPGPEGASHMPDGVRVAPPIRPPAPTPAPENSAEGSSGSVLLPGDPGWLESNPPEERERIPHTGNPMPGDPEEGGG
jgi:cell division protein FtsB